MADHGEVQYSTADGNDYPAHEAAYTNFVHIAFIGALYCINTLLGLTIASVIGNVWVGAIVLIFVAPPALVHGLATGSRVSTLIALAISLLAFAFTATG